MAVLVCVVGGRALFSSKSLMAALKHPPLTFAQMSSCLRCVVMECSRVGMCV